MEIARQMSSRPVIFRSILRLIHRPYAKLTYSNIHIGVRPVKNELGCSIYTDEVRLNLYDSLIKLGTPTPEYQSHNFTNHIKIRLT